MENNLLNLELGDLEIIHDYLDWCIEGQLNRLSEVMGDKANDIVDREAILLAAYNSERAAVEQCMRTLEQQKEDAKQEQMENIDTTN